MDIAVLGAGVRGRDVAQLCAVAGHAVNLYDEAATAAMDGIDAIEQRLDEAVDAGEYESETRADALETLHVTTGLEAAVTDADIVMETATSDTQALQEQFATVEEATGRETLVAPTTDIAVTAAAAGLRHPDRAVGLRFQDPLARRLVEVVVADQTGRDTCERATEFVESVDRSPVVVRDAPGTVSTRSMLALEAEAMRVVEDGIASVTAVDETLELGYDHPIGPLESADRAGLDRRLEQLEVLSDQLGDRFEPPALLDDLVADGHTGMGSGEGFYVWEDGEPSEPAVSGPDLPARESGPDDPGL